GRQSINVRERMNWHLANQLLFQIRAERCWVIQRQADIVVHVKAVDLRPRESRNSSEGLEGFHLRRTGRKNYAENFPSGCQGFDRIRGRSSGRRARGLPAGMHLNLEVLYLELFDLTRRLLHLHPPKSSAHHTDG